MGPASETAFQAQHRRNHPVLLQQWQPNFRHSWNYCKLPQSSLRIPPSIAPDIHLVDHTTAYTWHPCGVALGRVALQLEKVRICCLAVDIRRRLDGEQ